MERSLDGVAVVARLADAREVGRDDAHLPANQPVGSFGRQPRPMPEVVRAFQTSVVPGPEDGGIAGLKLATNALELGRANRLAAPNRTQVEQSSGANHLLERDLLNGPAVWVETQRSVQVGSNVLR